VHRAARICGVAQGEQILLSETTRELVVHALPPGMYLRDAGPHQLKGLEHLEHLSELQVVGRSGEEATALHSTWKHTP
jgi:class 3 adenylate cyclase